eukprot:7525753-Pyramimonas_sp.AAC.1
MGRKQTVVLTKRQSAATKRHLDKARADPAKKAARSLKVCARNRQRWAEGATWAQKHPRKKKAMEARMAARRRARDRAAHARQKELQQLTAPKLAASSSSAAS